MSDQPNPETSPETKPEVKPEVRFIGYYNANAYPISFQTSKGRTVEVSEGQPVLAEGFLVESHPDLENMVREKVLTRILPENPMFKRWNTRVRRQSSVHVVQNGPNVIKHGQKNTNAPAPAESPKPPESIVSSKSGIQDLPDGASIEDGQIVFRGMKFVSAAAVTKYEAGLREKAEIK